MLEQAYRTEATDMTAWVSGTGLSSWVGRRYGAQVADNGELFGHLSNAWSLLQRSVYSGDAIRIAPVQLVCISCLGVLFSCPGILIALQNAVRSSPRNAYQNRVAQVALRNTQGADQRLRRIACVLPKFGCRLRYFGVRFPLLD